MAVRLRLRRVGRKKSPIYKVVAADKRSPRDGRFIESVGQYEPLRKENTVEFNEERVMYWLKNGAQPSATVQNLLRSQGLWLKWSLLKKGADESTITEQLEKFSMQRAERDQRAKEKSAEKKKDKAAAEAEKPAEAETAADETQKAEEKQESPQPAEEQQDAPAEKEADAPAEEQASPEEEQKTQEDATPDKTSDSPDESKKEETPGEDSTKKE